jgi:putative endopeptidase
LALIALQNIIQQGGRSLDTKGADGFTELQRFFLADANAECTEFRPEMMGSSILSNPHSWNQYRVNNVIANMPEFTKAFACAQRYFL